MQIDNQAAAAAAAGSIGFALIIAGIAGLLVYFVPTMIAVARKKTNVLAVALVNILLGWTFVGWVVALVWSVSTDAADSLARPAQPQGAHLQCRRCQMIAPPGTKFCPTCGREFFTDMPAPDVTARS